MSWFLLAWLGAAHAEPTTGGEVVPVEETVPPTLVEQAALHYPEAALPEQAHGDVTVRVHVGEDGRVEDASFVSGPEVFRVEALRAGRRLRFEPATRGGETVPALIDVYFHFAPPEHDHPEPIYEIVVGADPDARDTHARETLDEADLDANSGGSLADTVGDIAGVSMAEGTADTAKPIIRGQVERRLLLLYDGIRHESQKWGPDHAPEIDPFSAGSISVIKGAAGVRYGPDAIGGVILVDPPRMRREMGVGGKALLMGGSNGRRGYAALRLDAVPTDALSLRVEGNLAASADKRAPDYVLGNSASRLINLGAAAEWRPGASTLSLSWRRYDLSAGVFYGVSNATPDDFTAGLDAPVNADRWTSTYAIDEPRQRVIHDLARARFTTPLGSYGELTATYSFQMNQREEHEQTRDSVEGPQYDFTLRTHALDLTGTQHSHGFGAAGAEGGFGAQVVFQENVYRGLPLTPNFRSLALGVHAWERLSFEHTALEGGLRYDHVGRTTFLTESAYERHARRDTLSPNLCALADGVARCPLGYDLVSASLGGLWRVIPDTLDAKLDLSTASRVPNVDELWLNGSAPSFPVYALGTPDLGIETTWSASPTLGLRLPWVEGEVGAYASVVQSYVQFAPELTEAGSPAFDVTVRGAYPRYGFTPVDALFYGVDGSITLGPTGPVGLSVVGAVVRAQDLSTGKHLVGIVPDRGSATAHLRPPEFGPMFEPFVDIEAEAIGRQSRVDPALDFAPPPDGVVLVHAAAGVSIPTRSADLTVGVEGRNLGNARYREYTSLLRYYADQPGRDVRLRVGLTF